MAEEFFAGPALGTFQALCKGARSARVGPAVEEWARHYLETGQRPEPAASKRERRPSGKRKGEPEADWPLPAPDIVLAPQSHVSSAPMCGVLIEIALNAKDPDEVLRWYDHRKSQQRPDRWGTMPDTTIAEAVKDSHPERAIAIWKEAAERHREFSRARAAAPVQVHYATPAAAASRVEVRNPWCGYVAVIAIIDLAGEAVR